SHAALRGLSDGLPWFLHALRPSGFLARAADLERLAGTSASPGDDLDDAQLAWFTREGWDGPGDLIVGAEALEAWRAARDHRNVVEARNRPRQYMRLAEAALERAIAPQAQLPGEAPKFTALTDQGGHIVQVLVKFSAPIATAAGQRQGELLLAEHLAHGYLNARGVCAVHSRLFRFGGRIFLEIDRFDRVGADGRRSVTSLAALGLPQSGQSHGWAAAASQLSGAGVLPRNDARQIRLVEAFSELIGNIDRGPEDLTLFHRADGRFALAPAYDLSPSVFTTADADVRFVAPAPSAATADVWQQAVRLAEGYWERLAAEPQFSTGFREQCSAALAALRAMPHAVPLAH